MLHSVFGVYGTLVWGLRRLLPRGPPTDQTPPLVESATSHRLTQARSRWFPDPGDAPAARARRSADVTRAPRAQVDPTLSHASRGNTRRYAGARRDLPHRTPARDLARAPRIVPVVAAGGPRSVRSSRATVTRRARCRRRSVRAATAVHETHRRTPPARHPVPGGSRRVSPSRTRRRGSGAGGRARRTRASPT